MKVMSKRVYRLEQRLGVGEPSAEELRVMAIVEAIRRRRAERLGESNVPLERAKERRELSGRSIVEVLRCGRFGQGNQ